MVKKLFKHEFIALFRSLLPIECVVLGMGILTRIILLFETDTTAFKIINISSIIIFAISLIVGIVSAYIFGITRFYKNLFTQEGYLSFTLPVTPAQHIIVKLVTATIMQIAAFLFRLLLFVLQPQAMF